jgi:hypothetical protein
MGSSSERGQRARHPSTGDACLIAVLAAAVHDRDMCRWNAHFGQPVAVGDGFGLGWYGTNRHPFRLEIPESTALIIQSGPDERRSFQPHEP